MRPYVIRQGDYLTKLASAMGFDADEVWNDPANDTLREQRPNRDILAPGDVLQVPSAPEPGLSIDVGGTNRFRATPPRVGIDITMRQGDTPLANEPFLIRGAGADREASTDGDGRLQIQVPVHVSEVSLVFYRRGFIYPVRVGHLDPIDEMSGVRQRLQHLAHGGWNVSGLHVEPDAEHDRRSLIAFQEANGLPATGEIDDATRAKLAEVHKS